MASTSELPQPGQCCDDAPALDAAATVPEDMLDELDAHGVSSELVNFWAAQEASVVPCPDARATAPPGTPPTQARDLGLRLLVNLTTVSQLCIFDAALLLDLYHVRRSGDDAVRTLPATCAAVVTLLRKNSSCMCRVHVAELAVHVSQFASAMHGMGYDTAAEVTREDIVNQEEDLIRVLGWHVNAPSVQKWMTVLCARLDILSARRYAPLPEWVLGTSTRIAWTLVMQHTTAASMPPRCMAVGLLGICLVMGRLLPVDMLRPAAVSAHAWEELFLVSQGLAAMPSCALTPQAQTELLRMTSLVAGCDVPSLQENAHSVIALMCRVVTGLRGGQGPGHQNSAQTGVPYASVQPGEPLVSDDAAGRGV